MEYRIEADFAAVDRMLADLARKTKDLTPVLEAVGGVLKGVAEEAFETETSPDGKPWPDLSPVTIRRRERDGHVPITKLQVSGQLAASVGIVEIGPRSVTVGTSVIYAAVQQFGADKGEFGKGRRPVPWGDIPARAYLGVSDEAKAEIEKLITDWLALAARPSA